MSHSLRPHESQHARPPCPSPTPGVYPNSCPSSSWWCHPAISSVVPFSSCPQSLPASGSFPMSQLLLSHKKEYIWVSSDEVDEPRTYYTELSKSERRRYISYPNAYIQNLEKWYWRIYLQGNSEETDIENRLMDIGRGEERVRCVERVTQKFIICRIANGNLLLGPGNSNGLCINLEGWDGERDGRESQKGGDMCIPMADSCWGLTENHKIL